MLHHQELQELYRSGLSMMEIADKLGVSHHKVCYWMDKHNIPRRTRSDATYIKCNPDGDPFSIKTELNKEEVELRGMGLGLYWGEGTRTDQYSVRLGNSDPELIKKFKEFLVRICGINESKLRFSLQVFNDMDEEEAERYWLQELAVNPDQFIKTTITPSRGPGTYRNKTKFGVLTIRFHNKKLRNILMDMLR